MIPTPLPRDPTRNCFQCRHLIGPTEDVYVVCGARNSIAVIADPPRGCAFFDRNPDADPAVNTHAEWCAAHGRPVEGFNVADQAGRWPPALSAAELRRLYAACRTPETRALVWEIARLQDVIRRAHVVLSNRLPRTPEGGLSPNAQRSLTRLAELIAEEIESHGKR